MNPFSGKLTPQRELILLCLMGRKVVPAELLSEVLWPDPDDMPDNWYNQINVHLTGLRKNIAPKWRIVNWYQRGWSLVSVD